MGDSFDVIVVGARCAGSTLAAFLARGGVRVALVERATFPRDTLSSHIFQAPGISVLARLGVLERVRETGAESISRLDYRQNDFRVEAVLPLRPGDVGGFMSVRRFVLDPILAEAAAQAGAQVMMGSTVTGLVDRDGRVSGVRISAGGSERDLSARLVVGADGRNSTVARLVGARKYHVVPSERFLYWGFFEGVDHGPEPVMVFHHWEGRMVLGCPADSGLYQVGVMPDNRCVEGFRADRERAFIEYAMTCAPVSEKLTGATKAGKLLGILRFESFFRESAGPGWVLLGDAGQFKDPAPGQGMTDAFRQAEALAPVISRAVKGPDAELDHELRGWQRWRDRDAFEHHWLACDLGAAGAMPTVLSEVMRRLDRRGEFDRVIDIFQHRAMPSDVVSPARVLSTATAMLARRGYDRRGVLREVRELVVTDARRKSLRRRPVLVDPATHPDATESVASEELPEVAQDAAA